MATGWDSSTAWDAPTGWDGAPAPDPNGWDAAIGWDAASGWDGTGVTPPAPEPDVTGGFLHPFISYQNERYRQEQAEKKRRELESVERELAQAEESRRIGEQKAQEKLEAEEARRMAALDAYLQEEIRRLRTERALLMRMIDDDEAIFALMVARPFH